MAERYSSGAVRGKVKFKLPFLEGTLAKMVGWVALYLFWLTLHRRAILCWSVSHSDKRTSPLGPISSHSLFKPPTSRCFSCDCGSWPEERGAAATPPLRSTVPPISSVQTDESDLLHPGGSKALPAEKEIDPERQLLSVAVEGTVGASLGVSSPKQAVLHNNFEELQQLLEDEGLRIAAQDLFRKAIGPSSASASSPALNTLEDWVKFDFAAFHNVVGGRPAEQVDGSSVAVELTRDILVHYHQLANLSFLTLSLESPKASAETADAPELKGEASRAQLLRKLALVAGEVLGFSDLTPSSRESSQRVLVDSTSQPAAVLRERHPHMTIVGEVGRGSADADSGGSSGGEYRAIDIRGLTGTANPFLFLRFLLLGVALTGFEQHFDENFRGHTRPFFGPDTFLASLSTHRTPQLFGAMTKTDRSPKKKGTFVSRLLRKSSACTPVMQTWSTLDISGIPDGSHKLLLSILQRHLEIILAYAQQQIDVLKEAKVPVESSLPFSENLHRLHTYACLPDGTNKIQIPCAFEDTMLRKLARTASDLGATDDEAAREEIHQQNLKAAFLTVTGLAVLPLHVIGRALLFADVSVWIARLLSDPPLGADARKSLAPYGLHTLLSVRKRDISRSEHDAQLVERALRRRYDSRTALRACLYAFMLIPRPGPYNTEGRSPLDFVKTLFADEPAPIFASAKVNPVTFDDLVEHREPYGYTFTWLFEFLSQGVLLRRLPPDWRETVTQVFRFAAHTAALQQVTTFHSLFRIKAAPDLKGQTVLQNESVVKRCEDQIYKWSRHGFSPAILEADKQNRSFEEKWHTIKLENMPTPNVTEWWRRVHHIILEGLKAYLDQQKYLEGLEDNIYTVVADTVKRMEEGTSPDSTFFLARVGTSTRQTRVARITGKIKRTLGKLLREVPPSKHVVWLGVKFDRSQIMMLLTRLRDIAQNTADAGTALLLDEAFMKLVAETVRMKTIKVLRQPLFSLRNVSVLSIRSDYARLSSLQRAAEFDDSLCAEHCVELWQVILAFVYPALLNPSMLLRYEREFSRAGAKRMLNSPDYVNSLRYVFASDATLDFWDYTTPSHIKAGLKGMVEGQSFMYANMMRLAGHFFDGSLGLHNLGHTLQIQAPFMGQTAKDWIRKRRAARKQAIFAALTLGLMFVYTVASSLEIFSMMKDVGMTPVEECSWNSIAQDMACIQAGIDAQSVTAPLFAALTDVFNIGVYAGVGSTIMGALGIRSVYSIVRSESRKIMRMEMVLSQIVVKLWRHVVRFASKGLAFVRRRKTIISTMMTRATTIFNKKGQAAPAPQVHETGLRLVDSVLEEQPPLGPSD